MSHAQHPVKHGLGLRIPHYDTILATLPALGFFEIISENFMIDGGKPIEYLEKFRSHYPMVFHGVSLSIGSADPLNTTYLGKLKNLIQRYEPLWVSDHLCWTGIGGHNSHDLLPLPYNEETLAHVSERILQVQEYLGRTLVLENPSSYVRFATSTMTEWDFISELVARTHCELLLDINNIFVSSYNHGFNPYTYLRSLPLKSIRQIHLAGHQIHDTHLLDTHDHPVREEVWQLYREALNLFGEIPTMIEWDDHIPKFEDLYAELLKAKAIANEVCHQ